MPKLAENLKSVRKEKQLLQKDIAKFLELPLRTYQSYEYGEAEPSVENILKLCNYFDVTADYLLGRSEDPTRH